MTSSGQEPEITFALASEADLRGVAELDLLVTGQAKPEFWASNLARTVTGDTSTFIIARHGPKIVGLILGTIGAWEFGSPATGWVHAIFVHPDFRNRGIASELLAEIKTFFSGRGINTIRTMLHVDDKLLMSFFRFHGLSAGPYVELEATID